MFEAVAVPECSREDDHTRSSEQYAICRGNQPVAKYNVLVMSISRSAPDFQCPNCKLRVICEHDDLVCGSCQWRMSGKNGVFNFGSSSDIWAEDSIDRVKQRFKRYSRLYAALINLFSPVYPQLWFEVRAVRRSLLPGQIAVNIGSGNSVLGPEFTNVDLMPYPNVHVVTGADRLPFDDSTVDVLVSIAVLEHVRSPGQMIEEFFRVLRPGGTAYIFVPFIQGFHASPHDYQRYTLPGLEHQLRAFEIVHKVVVGPTSGLIWIASEWTAILLCFGSKKLQAALALGFATLLSPLKFLDVFLRQFPGAENISTGFFLAAEKPS